jgi:hypothetical protein
MRNPVAIALARDIVPARRLLLSLAIAVFALALPGLGHGQTVKKTTSISRHTSVQTPASRVITPPAARTSVSLRAAQDSIPATAKTDGPTGAIRGGTGSATIGLSTGAATPLVGSPGTRPSLQQQKAFTREWYPESHSYLRPYHYKWRYWTPG